MERESNSNPANEISSSRDAACDLLLPYVNTLFWCLREGVIFVDRRYEIGAWSQAVETITGRKREGAIGQTISPALLHLHDSSGNRLAEDSCPVRACLQSGKIRGGDYRIIGPSGREVKIELTATPVINANNEVLGSVVLLHDASVQLDLQRQLRDLYETSVLDPLTQLPNRGEFERVLTENLRACQVANTYNACLIVCDIDFFKSINDNYNHHVGDQALVAFADQLKQFVRAQDLVCRYGGEEFVILCAQCDIESAIDRAEEIRKSLEVTPLPMLDGKCITASFGVSQLRETDTATDFFVRADSALLKAKELGRNRVVAAAMPSGETMKEVDASSLSGIEWKQDVSRGKSLVVEEFVTQTPVSVLVEKLRGFIVEFEADIRQVESDFASIEVEIEDPSDYSRRGRFQVTFEFCEREVDNNRVVRSKSFIRVVIKEARRKWFSVNSTEMAPVLLAEIRRYLMLTDESSQIRVDSAGSPVEGR